MPSLKNQVHVPVFPVSLTLPGGSSGGGKEAMPTVPPCPALNPLQGFLTHPSRMGGCLNSRLAILAVLEGEGAQL